MNTIQQSFLNENNEENQSRLEFEKVLSDISRRMINPPPDQIDLEIENGLKAITLFFEVDCAVLFQRLPEHPDGVMTHLFERTGVADVPVGEPITAENYPYLTRVLNIDRKIACVNSIDDLPEAAKTDRRNYVRWNIKSSLSIPLGTGEEYYGTLVFITLENEIKWPETIIRRATVIGEIFSNALARKYANEHLKQSFEEIEALKNRLESQNTYLQKEIKLEHNYDNIIGKSEPLQLVFLRIEQSAPTDAPVVILGETGTGKELIARAIHDRSQRSRNPLIKIDCGSLSPTMIERELFGHEQGAFTGAHKQQIGKFELADGSTLFLDEVGELPMELQPKLLRAIQDGEFERLGNPKTRKTDVRIIAATNRNLKDEVDKGRFRKDLWYRLNVFPIMVPPLRERRDDIPSLVQWFVKKHSKKMGKQIKRIPETVLADLSNRSWPGNIRELENTIQRSLISSNGDVLQVPEATSRATPAALELPCDMTLKAFEKMYIQKVLKRTKGRVYGPKGAAVILGLNHSTLRSRMKKLGII